MSDTRGFAQMFPEPGLTHEDAVLFGMLIYLTVLRGRRQSRKRMEPGPASSAGPNPPTVLAQARHADPYFDEQLLLDASQLICLFIFAAMSTESTTPASSPSATSVPAALTPEPASCSWSRTWTSASSTPTPTNSSASSSSTPTATTSPPAAHQAGQRKHRDPYAGSRCPLCLATSHVWQVLGSNQRRLSLLFKLPACGSSWILRA
jgi:hypothetical protein